MVWRVVLGAAMMALGAWLLADGVGSIRMGRRSPDWPSVPGRVTDSRISRGRLWHFDVRYDYEVDGISYEGKVLRAGEHIASRAEAEELEHHYAVGNEVAVRYNPARPGTAVLEPGLGSRAYGAVVGAVVLMASGLWVMAAAVGHQSTPSTPSTSSPQVELSFTGLSAPTCVAVDSAGAVYVCDSELFDAISPTATAPTFTVPTVTVGSPGRLLQLPPDSAGPRELLPMGLNRPTGLAVDSSGAIYVADTNGPSSYLGVVLKLTSEPNPAGGTKITGSAVVPSVLSPGGVAVDSAGTVYVTELLTGRVLQLPVGATTATELFKGPGGGTAMDVAVDSANNVYVTDYANHRVLKLGAAGTPPIELPFAGLSHPKGVAVDTVGNVYVADSGNHRVVKLAAGSDIQIELPFFDLRDPYDVAVDTAGNVYVTDQDNRRVLKIPPQ